MNECKVEVRNIHSEYITKDNVQEKLRYLDGVIVAPGFGSRGIEGKIEAIRFVREHKIPFLGICLGMQMACVEFARNVLGMTKAHSTEMDPDTNQGVICMMEEQKAITQLGGTMRLGSYDCVIKDGSCAASIYNKTIISERHRHRYEFNESYADAFEQAGMKAVGRNPKTNLVEIMELGDHPFFIGVQFHPEYKSTVENPHPLFSSLVRVAKEVHENRNGHTE
jgi:CTP synthase